MIIAAIITPALWIMSPTMWMIAARTFRFSSSDSTERTSSTFGYEEEILSALYYNLCEFSLTTRESLAPLLIIAGDSSSID